MNEAPDQGETTELPAAPAERGSPSHPRADVLALLPDPASARACLDMAEDAARAVRGNMAAAHIGADPERMIAAPEEIDLQRLRDLDEGSPQHRFECVSRVFEDWKQASPDRKPFRFKDCRGDLGRCVAGECRESALVVMPARGSLDARDAFHDVLFNEGKLVLVPPAGAYAGHLLRHVVIGWRPHANVRGAVVAARPWLASAERITVLCVDENHQSTASELLAELDLAGDVVSIRSQGRPVGKAILDFAATVDATCLLIGAYRHGYLIELILGRDTRYLLAHRPLPLMMKH
ncbi:universal stress protein [Sinorhizobium saheli]|jgi:nucleotide-binding universal stress UspA family protein|uniref:Universal stress protein UspA n=1 Tax=Sinorhizobium saheli TaxID=36856 RepID=A0A178Y8U4_SINSA|nr:universal stress protein [Sinorhizobium saheli]MQW90482.1 universal stress protein [Sinorhizobium saheli]OAP43837.1 universal stress protein UspA [Sinorhizobium saheli]